MTEAVWTLAAEADVQQLYEQLELREEGSGDRFYHEVLSSVRLLECFPEMGPVVFSDRVRRMLVVNRHYGLYYVSERRGLILHALLDLRQNPEFISRRLGNIP